MSGMLDNKTAIITGAASGIGLAITRCFLREGARVLMTDIDSETGERECAALAVDAEVHFFHNDVSDAASCQAAVDLAVETFGRLDIAVNNAGVVGELRPLHECSLEGWQETMDVNVNGVFYGMRAQIPAMLEAGGGAILNLASIAGKTAMPAMVDYVTSKHAVVGMSKVAALDYVDQGIRVNSIGPGLIETPLADRAAQDDHPAAQHTLAKSVAMHPIGRLGTVEEVAELAAWLCCDRASFCTGSYYPVNGGYLAH